MHDDKGKVISAGRGAAILKAVTRNDKGSLSGKNDAFSKYEKSGLTGWPGDSIPDHIEVIRPANGVPLYGYPALKDSGSAVDFVLCKTASEAQKMHLSGVKKLMEFPLLMNLHGLNGKLDSLSNSDFSAHLWEESIVSGIR